MATELTNTLRNGSGHRTEMLNECIQVNLKDDTGDEINEFSGTHEEELIKKGKYLPEMVLDPPLSFQFALKVREDNPPAVLARSKVRRSGTSNARMGPITLQILE